MKKLINFIPAGVFSVIATAIVAYFLLTPKLGFSEGFFSFLKFEGKDKVAHAILFCFLNFAYLFDYTKFKSPHHTNINKELAYTMLAMAIGLLTETGQLAMAMGRTFEVNDIIADAVGAIIAFLYMHWRGAHMLRKHIFSKSQSRKKRGRRHHHTAHRLNERG